MNNILENILMQRRSCRKFTSEAIAPDAVQDLKRAALCAPTSKNCKSWQFVFVQNPETIAALAQCKQAGAAFIVGAPLAIVVFGNPAKTDVWIEDASIASTFLLVQAQALGLGACWAQLRLRGFEDGRKAKDIVSQLLGAPEGLEPLCVIGVGHPDEQHRPYSDDRLPWDQMHDEKF